MTPEPAGLGLRLGDRHPHVAADGPRVTNDRELAGSSHNLPFWEVGVRLSVQNEFEAFWGYWTQNSNKQNIIGHSFVTLVDSPEAHNESNLWEDVFQLFFSGFVRNVSHYKYQTQATQQKQRNNIY